MQSFLRFMFVCLLIIGAFIGGWFTSDLIKQDPFLSNIFHSNNDQYQRFIRDLSSVIQDTRIQDQTAFVDAILERQEQLTSQLINYIADPAYAMTEDILVEDASREIPYVNKPSDEQFSTSDITEYLYDLEPTQFVNSIIQQMSVRDKLSFLVWARSRFSDEQIRQIESLLSKEITPETIIQLYQYARPSLNGSDLDYLLTFVDRYIATLEQPQSPENVVPVLQANESPTVDHYSGN